MRVTISKLLPFLWMMFVYLGTLLLAGRDPMPPYGLARILFEARHVVTHILTFALQVWLLSRAVNLPGFAGIRRDAALVILVGLTLGLGQETLQTLIRHDLYTLDSLWDLTVDLGGSTLGWWLYNRRALTRPLG